ncbi:FAD-binding- type 2 [Apiospora phragmitis]|uniref:FAD-binding- type 2 n=1 Tax=Apiospora phragmitis TaxID=2905665 RepID=A0ABR1TWD1_9PEZI
MGADNALEFDVITADGKRRTAYPTENANLYWALGGGGAGNYALVLSVITKAHPDGPVGGATITFTNTNDAKFWAGIITAWLKLQPTLNDIPRFSSLWFLTKEVFRISYAILPDGTEAGRVQGPLPVRRDAQGNRHHTPPPTKQASAPASTTTFSGSTVTSERPGANAVLPAWRDVPFTTELARIQRFVNAWQIRTRSFTPGGGSYMNEATFDAPDWKTDYQGATYPKLEAIKERYDPDYLFWVNAGVGSDSYWRLGDDGRLCCNT